MAQNQLAVTSAILDIFFNHAYLPSSSPGTALVSCQETRHLKELCTLQRRPRSLSSQGSAVAVVLYLSCALNLVYKMLLGYSYYSLVSGMI